MLSCAGESGDVVGEGQCLQRSASDASSGYAGVLTSCGREGLFFFAIKAATIATGEGRRRGQARTGKYKQGGRKHQVLVQRQTTGELPQRGALPP